MSSLGRVWSINPKEDPPLLPLPTLYAEMDDLGAILTSTDPTPLQTKIAVTILEY